MKLLKKITPKELKRKTLNAFPTIRGYDNARMQEAFPLYYHKMGNMGTTREDEKEGIREMKNLMNKNIFFFMAYAIKEEIGIWVSIANSRDAIGVDIFGDLKVCLPNSVYREKQEKVRETIGEVKTPIEIDKLVVFYNNLVDYINKEYIEDYNNRYKGDIPKILKGC